MSDEEKKPVVLKLQDIAKEIQRILRHFERYPDKWGSGSRLQSPSCSASGSKVMVRYINTQSTYSLSKEQALIYMRWLQTGKAGTHQKALSEGVIV